MGLGVIETYNTRVDVENKEVEEVLVRRHLCGSLRVIGDREKGSWLVDQWTDQDGFLRRRIVVGVVSFDGNAEEKLNCFEKGEGKAKKDRKVLGCLRSVLGEFEQKNAILEEFMDEEGEFLPHAELKGDLVFKRDEEHSVKNFNSVRAADLNASRTASRVQSPGSEKAKGGQKKNLKDKKMEDQ